MSSHSIGDADLTRVVIFICDVRHIARDRLFAVSMFSDAERQRADRFHYDVNRDEYLTARGIVRSFVAKQAGLRPEEIVFTAEQNHQKPRLMNSECAGIDVSISHSAGRVVCGFLRNGHVGVDVEAHDHHRNVDLPSVAQRVFSVPELEALNCRPQSEFRSLFLRVWTRKEAVLKGAGVGLSADTRGFDVVRRSPEGIEDISPVLFADRMWTCHSATPAAGVELSVAWTA